jgi:hypothetical protein
MKANNYGLGLPACLMAVLFVATAFSRPQVADASGVVFVADAEGGTLKEWTKDDGTGDNGQSQMCDGPLCGTPGSYAYMNQDTANGGPSAPRAGKYFLRLRRTAEQPTSKFSGGVNGNRVIVQRQQDPIIDRHQVERWAGLSMWVPGWFSTAILTDWNILFGWHGYGRAPTFMFAELLHDNVLRIKSRTFDGSLDNVNWWSVSSETTHYTGKFPRAQWVDFVFNYRFDHRPVSAGGIGFIRAWINGVQVIDYKGPVGYQANAGDPSAYFWMGSYAGDRNEHYRMYYYDEVRFGNSSATYAGVAPGGGLSRPESPSLVNIQ